MKKHMITYKYKKGYYICDMVSLALWLVIVFCAAYWYTRSFLETLALLALALFGAIPGIGFIRFDYKILHKSARKSWLFRIPEIFTKFHSIKSSAYGTLEFCISGFWKVSS